MYEGTRKTASSTKNSPGALNMKAGEKLVSTILAASTACEDSRLGTNSGIGYFFPDVRADGIGATCSQLGLFPGAASTEGRWPFFVRERHCTVLNYWSEQLIARNKTEKSTDELPIDQEYRPGDRAGQAHRVQLAARSIISFGYFVVGGISVSFVLFTVSSKSSVLK